jgi:hypothetical protein
MQSRISCLLALSLSSALLAQPALALTNDPAQVQSLPAENQKIEELALSNPSSIPITLPSPDINSNQTTSATEVETPSSSTNGDKTPSESASDAPSKASTNDAEDVVSLTPTLLMERPIVGQVSLTNSELENINREILAREIELLRLNTNFRLNTTDRNKLKPWRTFFYNLVGSGVATAGITTIAAERWRTWRTPAKASRNVLKAGPILLLTSHSIMTGGILIEAFLDAAKDHKQRKAGTDPKSTQKKATELRDAIDQKLKERSALVANLGSISINDQPAIAQEGKILEDIRNLALQEYKQFHIRAKKRICSRNVSYVNGFFSATTGGYLGSLMGLLAVTNRNPRYAGPAGLGFTLSGASLVWAPILGRAAANLQGKVTTKRLNKELGPIAPANLQQHLGDLKMCSGQDDNRLKARLAIYEDANAIFQNQAKMNAAEKKKADKEYVERCLFNAAIGGSKMAWGIQLMNAGFNFKQAPKPPKLPAGYRKPQTPAQQFGHRVAQGSTSYIPGTGLWIIDTLQARTRGELDLYNMGSQFALPHQKLKTRLDKLEDMETRLKTSHL